MATPPRIGKFNPSASITWGNGTLFNGYLLAGLSLPALDGLAFPDVRIQSMLGDGEIVPSFYKIPIKDGQFDQVAGLFYNADLSPNTTVYYAWLYTNHNFQVAGPATPFAVTTDSIPAPSFSIGTPTNTGAPTPDEYPPSSIVIPNNLTGNVDANGYDITGIGELIANGAAQFNSIVTMTRDVGASGNLNLWLVNTEASADVTDGQLRITCFTTNPGHSLARMVSPTGTIINVKADGRIYIHIGTTYANDAAAGAGGVSVNEIYGTPTGELRYKL